MRYILYQKSQQTIDDNKKKGKVMHVTYFSVEYTRMIIYINGVKVMERDGIDDVRFDVEKSTFRVADIVEMTEATEGCYDFIVINRDNITIIYHTKRGIVGKIIQYLSSRRNQLNQQDSFDEATNGYHDKYVSFDSSYATLCSVRNNIMRENYENIKN